MNNTKGFTILELLIVIAIISLNSTIAFVAVNSANEKARDTKRITDLLQVSKALELYYNDHGEYPPAPAPTLNNCTNEGASIYYSGAVDCDGYDNCDWSELGVLLEPYMKNFPNDPHNYPELCSGIDTPYWPFWGPNIPGINEVMYGYAYHVEDGDLGIGEAGQAYELITRLEGGASHSASCANNNYTFYTNELSDAESSWASNALLPDANIGDTLCPGTPTDPHYGELFSLPH
jgi:prepilin-type N-terminal cleavage/methylation domain-containing protein